MSLTDGDAAADESAEPGRRRYKRRKVAIFLAYCGAGYQGMQKNPGAKTIEGDLEEALFHAGAVPETDRGCPKRYDWARSARTDKGVSAAGQVVSGRFYVDPPGFADRLNASLPPQIRVFGYKRAVNSFSAKKFCDRRRYVYLLPVFAVDPAAHRDREAVAASLGSEMEFAKCEACSERGRKMIGAVGRFFCGTQTSSNPIELVNDNCCTELVTNDKKDCYLEVKSESIEAEIVQTVDLNTDREFGHQVEVKELNSCEIEVVKATSTRFTDGEDEKMISNPILGHFEGTETSSNPVDLPLGSNELVNDNCHTELLKNDKKDCDLGVNSGSNEAEIVNKTADLSSDREFSHQGEVKELDNSEVDIGKATSTRFTYSEEVKERFNRILGHFVGTHNFHNFTTRTKAEDPSAHRYIVSFTANSTVNIDGMEFIRCEVVGQSFMLHQIRKMIGLAVAVMRNCAPESLITSALNKRVRINVPTAPELGLYLDECMFASYNNKWRETHEEVCMELYQDEAEKFKKEYIFLHIASTERKEGVIGLWLHSLNHRNYPDLLGAEADCPPAAPSHHNADENGEE